MSRNDAEKAAGSCSPGTFGGFAVLALIACAAASRAMAGDGDPDPTFGEKGKQHFSFPEPQDFANSPALAETPGGNLLYLVGATAGVGEFDALAIARVLPDGSLDDSFDGDGKRTLDPLPGSTFHPYKALVQADGRLLVSGVSKSTTTKAALCRFMPDGSIDTSFGSQSSNHGCYVSEQDDSFAWDIAIQNDGKIVATVDLFSPSPTQAAILRLTAAGTPDATFSDDGYAVLPNANRLRSLAVAKDSKILAGGWHFSSPPFGNADFYVARIEPEQGALDTSFNGTGEFIVGYDLGTTSLTKDDAVFDLKMLNDGSILLAGKADVGVTSVDRSTLAALLKLTPAGTLDAGFEQNGKAISSLNGDELAVDIAVQDDGRIIVASAAKTAPDRKDDFAAMRFNADGTVDTTFGDAGLSVVPFDLINNDSADAPENIALLGGKVLLAGYANGGGEFALARLESDRIFYDGFE